MQASSLFNASLLLMGIVGKNYSLSTAASNLFSTRLKLLSASTIPAVVTSLAPRFLWSGESSPVDAEVMDLFRKFHQSQKGFRDQEQ
jgi:hypothetical protein